MYWKEHSVCKVWLLRTMSDVHSESWPVDPMGELKTPLMTREQQPASLCVFTTQFISVGEKNLPKELRMRNVFCGFNPHFLPPLLWVYGETKYHSGKGLGWN